MRRLAILYHLEGTSSRSAKAWYSRRERKWRIARRVYRGRIRFIPDGQKKTSSYRRRDLTWRETAFVNKHRLGARQRFIVHNACQDLVGCRRVIGDHLAQRSTNSRDYKTALAGGRVRVMTPKIEIRETRARDQILEVGDHYMYYTYSCILRLWLPGLQSPSAPGRLHSFLIYNVILWTMVSIQASSYLSVILDLMSLLVKRLFEHMQLVQRSNSNSLWRLNEIILSRNVLTLLA